VSISIARWRCLTNSPLPYILPNQRNKADPPGRGTRFLVPFLPQPHLFRFCVFMLRIRVMFRDSPYQPSIDPQWTGPQVRAHALPSNLQGGSGKVGGIAFSRFHVFHPSNIGCRFETLPTSHRSTHRGALGWTGHPQVSAHALPFHVFKPFTFHA